MSLFFVTGIAGFIASALAARLISLGHTVVGVDNLSTGYMENVPPEADFYKADCQDSALYDRLPQGPYEAVFHIAGQSSGEISFDNPAYDLASNAQSTLHLLKFCLANNCKRLIYASTMSVYGEQPDKPVKEDASCNPQSFYGVGKLASEHYLRIYEQYGVRSTSLRLFNCYGPGQNMKNLRQGMISIFMAMMIAKEHITVKGGPERYRDFVYIDDVVNSFLLCLAQPKTAGLCINIGGSGRVTVRDLLSRMVKLSPKPVSVEYKGSTPGDVHGIYADQTLSRKVLDYKPKISLDEGLAAMYRWYAGGW